MVDGVVVIADGTLTTVDEASILAAAAPARASMLNRNADVTSLALAQDQTLTRLAARAPAPRPVVPVRHPQEMRNG